MRRSTLYICATAHLPSAKRDPVDRLIKAARRDPVGGRLIIGHPILVIEAHQFGFLVATSVVGDHPVAPAGISPALWHLPTIAFAADADWIFFDRDEPTHPDLVAF